MKATRGQTKQRVGGRTFQAKATAQCKSLEAGVDRNAAGVLGKGTGLTDQSKDGHLFLGKNTKQKIF